MTVQSAFFFNNKFFSRGGAMLRIISNSIVAIACALALQGCGDSPTGPTDPFNPNRPVDNNNRPPGPGPTVKAQYFLALFEEDCTAAPLSCSAGKRIERTTDPALVIAGKDVTYPIQLLKTYTLRLCTTHPGVPGRKIDMFVRTLLRTSVNASLFFDEGDPARQGTVCIGVANEMWQSAEGAGTARFSETGQDLINNSEQTNVQVDIGFRIVP